eukprot:11219855-Lingulodinium_polyedra.AAC.1
MFSPGITSGAMELCPGLVSRGQRQDDVDVGVPSTRQDCCPTRDWHGCNCCRRRGNLISSTSR